MERSLTIQTAVLNWMTREFSLWQRGYRGLTSRLRWRLWRILKNKRLLRIAETHRSEEREVSKWIGNDPNGKTFG